MSENVEYPKLSTDEQTKKAEKDVQLLDLKPEDRVFLDVLSLSIQNNKNINEFHYGILNRGIVRAIAELDITTALRIVNQESQTRSPRIEVLAELAKMALVRGMDVNSVDPILKQIETAVEADDFYLAWASDVPVLLMDASLSLEDVKPALAQRIFNLAIEIVTGKKDSKRFDLYRHESDAKAFMTQIIATKDPSRAEEFIQKYNVRDSRDSDVKPIHDTIQKYLEQGQLDAAFRVALQSGNVPSIAEVGVRIAKEDPQKLIHSITEKYVTRKKPWPASPGMAAQAYDYMASLLFQSGDSSVAEKLLQEARGLAEQQGKEGYEQLVKILSYRHPDEAIQLLDKIDKPSKHSITYNRLINEIAMRTVLHDATKAIEIYHLSTSSSLGKQDALVTLLVECKKQEKDTHVEFLLNEFKGNIIELKNTSHYVGAERNKISFENIYKISNYFPELALEIIREGVGQEPKIRGREMTDQLTVKKILEILERAGLSAEQKQEWIEFLSRKLFLREKEAFISGLLHNISTRSPELLSEKGILSFFLSLDPGKPDDIRTFEALLKSGLLPEQNIKESPQKNLTQFLSVSALLLSQELVKKQDFDFLLFDHLMKLSQAENSFVKEVALHAIKLLPRKIGELFYMSDDAALETLKKLFSLSPETQLWFNDLDNYIANEFYPLGNNLLRFVKKLASQGVNQLLPKSMEKARKTILLYLSEKVDLADYFLENLQLYYTEPWILQGMELAITHFSVAQKFMKAVDNGHEEWKQMPWVADVYAKAKEIKPENEEGWNTAHGEKLQGFSDRDPYENHHWKFTGAQIGLASSLADVLRSKANKESINQLGLSAESLQILRKIEQQINTAYNNFLSTINLSDAFPREDKLALLYPEKGSVKMTDLRENIQSFVARYLVQKVEGDVETLNKNLADIAKNLENILQEGLNRFLKVYEVDIPLYDKLYEEFDSLREAGQHPLEVYLGRDGIYAWLGRRAQDVARRRKLGFERRKQSKESGEVLEIKPKYLIYPRYYRDNINIETKREFLEQEGISPMADPLFYDTGYTGTIPEQIMKVMNFDSDEIDRRIRLLSASNVQRRVRGVPENARSEIIEYIEHNAKTENSAVGLIKDPQTGKIRPIAEPTGPEEQFYFMMVKQAIGRHYWLKEQLHHGPSESVNLDSEHFVIRVLQEYAPLFPSEFLSDPQTYLAKHGELLKGSQGEGEYPDEEILLFKLSDDTQIVAKRIELRKAKEARKEFSILIAARKAHLPTAEPVGFLSGKTEADHSYLLMKKIEGFSGRKFEKYLQESGKYSDEQIKSIMQTVTEKNKEMAELFRQTLSIDKRWRIKDTIIAFNEETGQVTGVTPIDWERVHIFDPSNPKQIDDSQ